MSNGEIINEINEILEKDPNAIPPKVYRRVSLKALSGALEKLDDVEKCVIENTQRSVRNEEDIRKLKVWDRGLAIFGVAVAAIATAFGIRN